MTPQSTQTARPSWLFEPVPETPEAMPFSEAALGAVCHILLNRMDDLQALYRQQREEPMPADEYEKTMGEVLHELLVPFFTKETK